SRWNLPQHDRDIALLLEHRNAEPRGVAKGEAEVRPAFLLKLLLVAVGRDRLHQGDRVLRLQHLGLEGSQVSVKSQDRRTTHGDVNGRRAALDARLQDSIDV